MAIASLSPNGRAFMLSGYTERTLKLRLGHQPISGGSTVLIDKDITWDTVDLSPTQVDISSNIIFEIPEGRRVTALQGLDTSFSLQAFIIESINEDFPNGGNFIVQSLKTTVSNAL